MVEKTVLHEYRMLIEWRNTSWLQSARMRSVYGRYTTTAWIPYAYRMTYSMRISCGVNADRIWLTWRYCMDAVCGSNDAIHGGLQSARMRSAYGRYGVAVCGPHAKSCCRNVMKSEWRLGFGVAAMLHASRMWSSFSMFTGKTCIQKKKIFWRNHE